MNDFKNWTEVTKGIYRYVLAASACYELHIAQHDLKKDISTATANIYMVGEWCSNAGVYFERELIHYGSIEECLAAACEDYSANMQ